MVGKLVSFWNGLFSGFFLSFREGRFQLKTCEAVPITPTPAMVHMEPMAMMPMPEVMRVTLRVTVWRLNIFPSGFNELWEIAGIKFFSREMM